MVVLSLSRQLLDTANRLPEKIAVEDGDVRVAYAELATRARRFATFLREQGIGVGDRVLLCVENSAEYVVALYGCWVAGAVACPVNSQARAREILQVLTHADASLVVADANNRQLRSTLAEVHVPVLLIPRGRVAAPPDVLNWQAVEAQSPLVHVADSPDAHAMILYTSGTTGAPKGILLTHTNLQANNQAIIQYLELAESDRVLGVLPFHYSYGNSVLNTHLAVGATIVLGPTMAYPQEVVNALRAKRITGFSGVPSSFVMLTQKTDWQENPGALRYVTQAGGAMGVELTRQLLSVLGTQTRLFVMYGQTEATARLTYLPPESLERKLGSAGIPLSGIELKIVDDHDLGLAPREIGNVLARGANIMPGYWNDSVATARVLKDGWLHTGDRGYLDEDGYLFLQGRSSEMIKTGAHRVNPEEIEEVACEVPGVQEAAAVGVPDELMGHVIHLYIVGQCSKATEQALLGYCREQLALHKVPKALHWRKSLPRTASGKLQRFKITTENNGESG